MKYGALTGAAIAFLLFVGGCFLFGPCGPASPIVYALMFPGLLLVELFDEIGFRIEGMGLLTMQIVFGATVGAIVAHLMSWANRPARNPAYSKCDICGTEMFAKYIENGLCVECRKRTGLGQSR